MPQSGRDAEDHIKALETVRATLTEGKKTGATDFIIGGDLNIEFRMDNANEDLVSIGTECTDLNAEGAARTRSPMRKIAMATAIESL